MRTSSASIFFLFSFAFHSAWSAGFIDHVNGTPYTWATTTDIKYKVDIDPMLGTIPIADVKAIVAKAFATWQTVPIANSSMQFVPDASPDIAENVTGANYQNYIQLNANGEFENQAPNDSGVFIILDSDGSILDDLLGDSTGILGIASPGKYNPTTKKISAGFAIINGTVPGLDESSLAYTITHEFGHLMNLSHTQLNKEEAFNDDDPDDAVVPLMFPFITNKSFSIVDPTFTGLVELDDQLGLGFLYPNQSAFDAKSILKGSIRRRTGEFVRGVNVICRNKADDREGAVSWISDQTYAGDGGYVCGNLSTSDYSVFLEPVEVAINIFDPDPPFIATEFYNGASESYKKDVDDRTQSTDVPLVDGVVTAGIDIILNEDGRLTSGNAITGMVQGAFPNLGYFIAVPPDASSLKLELTTPTAIDLDLYARCDDEFSLTEGVTSPPFFDPNGGAQQAEHAAVGTSGNETITISGASNPKIKGCVYHILVNDFFESSMVTPATFELKATISGANPRLTVSKSQVSIETFSGNETKIAKQTFLARGDTFNITGLTFNDIGTDPMENVTSAKLYRDTDQNGQLTSADELISTSASIDQTQREIAFTDLDEYIVADNSKSFFVTYDLVAPAKLPLALILFLAGVLAIPFRKRRLSASCLLVFLLTISCGTSDSVGRYEPRLLQESSVTAQGLSFGTDVAINIELKPKSVADFFD